MPGEENLTPGLATRFVDVECPLWVISGHEGANLQCLLYSRKRTWIGEAIRPSWAFKDLSFGGYEGCSLALCAARDLYTFFQLREATSQ